MTITYQFDNVDQIDQNFINSLKAAFKGKSYKLNIEVEAEEVLSPKILASIEYVENGGELIHFENIELLKNKLDEKISSIKCESI